MAERFVRATFSDGRVIERGSVSKVYTHAFYYTYNFKHSDGSNRPGRNWGFSSSEDQAHRNMMSESAWSRNHCDSYEMLLMEVVPVVVLDKRRGKPVS